ncbi:MAG: DUF1302 domain-containing protein [Pseudomonadota bacterium]
MEMKEVGYGLMQHGKRRSMIGSTINYMLMPLFFMAVSVLPVNAIEIYKDSDTKVQWDNTIKYSAGYRVSDQEHGLIDDPNTDDGDRNFDPGLTSNRLDLLSEMDITYRDFGFRVSGAGWVDSVYLSDNDNDSPGTFNGKGKHDEFADDTEELNGLKGELLDAFIFGKGKLGSLPASFRAGRHTLLWGETLYFASNGIAYAQAPLDITKALGVPGTQAKELFMPVGQFSGQVQLVKNLTLAAYWQFEWRRSRMPAAGSYFSDADLIDAGGESLLTPPPAMGGLGILGRGDDLGGGDSTSEFGEGNSDQYGVALRFRAEVIDADIGLYYLHYNEKSTYWNYIDPVAGKYFMVFPEDIHMVGVSIGTQIGPVNVSGEISERFDTPLVSNTALVTKVPVPLPFYRPGDNDDHALYATGNSFHANLSAIYLLNGSLLWQGGNFVGEVGYTYLSSIDKNPLTFANQANPGERAFDSTRDDYALGFRFVFEPAYYQVFSGIDIMVPIGLGYSPKGRSPVDLKFNGGGADQGGDISIGLNIDYLTVWKFGLKYTNYFGSDDTQHLGDRDFISFSAQRSF